MSDTSLPDGAQHGMSPGRIRYLCRSCPLTFTTAEASNAHYDSSGHHQTFRCPECGSPLSSHNDVQYARCMNERAVLPSGGSPDVAPARSAFERMVHRLADAGSTSADADTVVAINNTASDIVAAYDALLAASVPPRTATPEQAKTLDRAIKVLNDGATYDGEFIEARYCAAILAYIEQLGRPV